MNGLQARGREAVKIASTEAPTTRKPTGLQSVKVELGAVMRAGGTPLVWLRPTGWYELTLVSLSVLMDNSLSTGERELILGVRR